MIMIKKIKKMWRLIDHQNNINFVIIVLFTFPYFWIFLLVFMMMGIYTNYRYGVNLFLMVKPVKLKIGFVRLFGNF